MAKKEKKPFFVSPVSALLIALFTALTFTFVKTVYDPVLMPRQLVLSGFAAVGLLYLLAQKRTVFRFQVSEWIPQLAFTAFVALSAAGISWSFNKEDAWYTLSRLLAFLSFFGFATYAFRSSMLTRKQLWWVILIFNLLAIVTLFGDMAEIGFTKGLAIFEEQLKGSFANPNLASSILYLITIAVLGAYQGKFSNPLFLVLLVANMLVLYLIGTSTILVAFAGAAALAALLYFAKKPIQNLPPLIGGAALGSAIVFASLAFLFYSFSHPELTEVFGNNSRFKIWKQTHLMIQEYGNGVGTGNWRLYFPKYGMEEFAKTFRDGVAHYQRPHNELLTAWSELGLGGLILWVAFWIGIFINGFHYLNRNNFSLPAIFLVSGLGGFWIVSFMDFPLERIEHNALFLLLVAQLSLPADTTDKKTKVAGLSKFLFAVGILACGFSAYVVNIRIKGETEIYKIQRNPNPNLRQQLLLNQPDKALNEYFSVDPTSAPVFYFSGLANFMEKNYEKAYSEFKKAESYHPYHLHIANGLGSACAQLGKKEEAIDYYYQVLRISPTYERTVLNLAEMYIRDKEFANALELLKRLPQSKWDKRVVNDINLVVFNLFEAYCTENNYTDAAKINRAKQILTRGKRMQSAFYKVQRMGMDLNEYFELLYQEGKILQPK